MFKKKTSEAIQNIIISVTALAFIAILAAGSMISNARSSKAASKSK